MMKRVRISTAVGAFSLHLLASMSFTTDTTQAKKDHERTRVAVQKLQQLVADHEHAIERHETEWRSTRRRSRRMAGLSPTRTTTRRWRSVTSSSGLRTASSPRSTRRTAGGTVG